MVIVSVRRREKNGNVRPALSFNTEIWNKWKKRYGTTEKRTEVLEKLMKLQLERDILRID